jgi:CheY-like chemotaxis protein
MPGESPLILYAEDNPDHAELVMRGLSRASAPPRVVHIVDGEAAMDYLERSAAGDAGVERPRLVLLDLRLPKLDGLEVLAKIKASAALSEIPVVILTTSNNARDVQRAYQHRANSYVVKPTEFSALSALLRDLSAYWLTWNVAAQ